MSNECKEELEQLINEEYRSRYPEINRRNKLNLPGYYNYFVDNETLYLTINDVTANMYDDPGAFDSWALVIKNWVLGINNIKLRWKRPDNINDLHYQRFLYRVQKATEVFYQWLEVDDSCINLLDDLQIKSGNKYLVNVPKQEVQNKASNDEAKVERAFVNIFYDILANAVQMNDNSFYNQLPVGLFKNEIADSNAIFPSKNAMIDIWGLNPDKKELHIFELKKEDAKRKMGIYSELFFYTMFEKDIIDGNFVFPDNVEPCRGICELMKLEHKSIKAHFLANKLHPLIDKNMMDIINEALEQYDIEFDFIKYNLDISCHKQF